MITRNAASHEAVERNAAINAAKAENDAAKEETVKDIKAKDTASRVLKAKKATVRDAEGRAAAEKIVADKKPELVPYAEFGARLMKLRKQAGMSRAELGEACGVAASTIVNYERGTRIPYADTAVKMANLFHITVPELVGEENPELTMTQAQAMDQMREINGKKGADRLMTVLSEAGHLAGGELSEPQLLEYSMELSRMSYEVNQRLREMYSNKRYQDSVEAKKAKTQKAVKALENVISSIFFDQSDDAESSDDTPDAQP